MELAQVKGELGPFAKLSKGDATKIVSQPVIEPVSYRGHNVQGRTLLFTQFSTPPGNSALGKNFISRAAILDGRE